MEPGEYDKAGFDNELDQVKQSALAREMTNHAMNCKECGEMLKLANFRVIDHMNKINSLR